MDKDQLNVSQLFIAPVYTIDKPEFLDVARKVSGQFIAKRKGEVDLNPNYPVYMTENLNQDPEMLDFANYTAQTAWNILNEQGYRMEDFMTFFESMWCQEHHAMSSMEKHIHGNGVVMTGFYFLDCPEKSSRVVFYDPRDAKVITGLPQKDVSQSTIASDMINFVPKEGQFMFSNSWLPHSFTRNESDKPLRFIHFNVAVAMAQKNLFTPEPAEVI
jgi:uncharacterized protein (TIGR02466 family)